MEIVFQTPRPNPKKKQTNKQTNKQERVHRGGLKVSFVAN